MRAFSDALDAPPIFAGGGAFNPNITDYIHENFPKARLTMLDETGVPGSAKVRALTRLIRQSFA